MLFLKDTLTQRYGEKPTEDEILRAFNICDADFSGDLNKQEVKNYLKGFEITLSFGAIDKSPDLKQV